MLLAKKRAAMRFTMGQTIGLVLGLAFAVVVVLMPGLVSDYWLFLCTTVGITVFMAASLGIVSGRAGIMSLCQLSFCLVGAWVVSLLNVHGWSPPTPVMVVIGGLATVPVGALLALPALRVRGINFAIITLGAAAFADTFFLQHPQPGLRTGVVFQRTAGFTSDKAFYYMVWAFVLAAMVLIWWVGRRPTGSSWLGVRHSERALAALGFSSAWSKISAFCLSAFLAGMAGALLAAQNGVVAIEGFGVSASLIIFAVALLCGARFFEGALLAAVFTVMSPELFRRIGIPQDFNALTFGIGMIWALAAGYGMAEAWRVTWRRRAVQAEEKRAAAAPPPEVAVADIEAELESVARRVGQRSTDEFAGPSLEVRNLTVRYGSVVALDSVDLVVERQTVHGLIGPNGAGKSTLVDAATGFLSSYEGEVVVGGRVVDSLSAVRRARAGLRRTFQQGAAVPMLTVHRYLELSARRSISVKEAQAVMTYFDGPPPHRTISEIDVGTRRLIEIAAGVIVKPDVLLLDEPAAGLASEESAVLGARLCELPERFGCAVLLIEHDIELVKAACTSITVLDFGKVIATGEAGEVLAHTAVIDAYLGAEEVGLVDA